MGKKFFVTLQVAKKSTLGVYIHTKNHPKGIEKEKKSPPNTLRRKKIHPQSKLPNPPGYLMVRPLRQSNPFFLGLKLRYYFKTDAEKVPIIIL